MVSGAGDVNGDGFDDLLIVDYYGAYLVLGRASGWSLSVPLEDVDASFVGVEANLLTAPAGDVDGDGFDDFLISDIDMNESAGEVFLFYGRSSGWSQGMLTENADASFEGDLPGAWAGYSMAGAHDENGDGFDDILVGAVHNYEAEGGGKTYLLLGDAARWSPDTSLNTASASFLGEAENDESGWSVALTEDVNGDGWDDILIAAPSNDEGGDSVGQVYLLIENALCNDQDGDGYGDPGDSCCPAGPETDCDDTNPDVYPGAEEVCDNGLDDDCDGYIDQDDSDCPDQDDDDDSATDDDDSADDDTGDDDDQYPDDDDTTPVDDDCSCNEARETPGVASGLLLSLLLGLAAVRRRRVDDYNGPLVNQTLHPIKNNRLYDSERSV